MAAEEPKKTAIDVKIDYVRLGLMVVVVVAVVWFALDNSQRVTIDWWVTEQRSRLIYVVVISALLGAIADRLIRRKRTQKD